MNIVSFKAWHSETIENCSNWRKSVWRARVVLFPKKPKKFYQMIVAVATLFLAAVLSSNLCEWLVALCLFVLLPLEWSPGEEANVRKFAPQLLALEFPVICGLLLGLLRARACLLLADSPVGMSLLALALVLPLSTRWHAALSLCIHELAVALLAHLLHWNAAPALALLLLCKVFDQLHRAPRDSQTLTRLLLDRAHLQHDVLALSPAESAAPLGEPSWLAAAQLVGIALHVAWSLDFVSALCLLSTTTLLHVAVFASAMVSTWSAETKAALSSPHYGKMVQYLCVATGKSTLLQQKSSRRHLFRKKKNLWKSILYFYIRLRSQM